MIEYFQVFGEILDCMIMYDKLTGKQRGIFKIITFL